MAGALIDAARARLPHVCSMHSDRSIFLGNGSRLYLDCGGHPELATPEVSNPWDAARYVLAGERILANLATDLQAAIGEVASVHLFKCNVDYVNGSTWGCHESYLHTANLKTLPAQIIPHLVSRIIFTGAGGFDNRSQGIEFTLSPRVPHLVAEVSTESTNNRGIFHTKNEPLCEGHHRLHVLCGESLCSETATWLKIGTTALVVALAEAELAPGAGVQLCQPLEAMSRYASDPECKATALLVDGNSLTACQIQRHYLGLAETHQHDSFMPPWAPEVCKQWRAILDRLEADAPRSVNGILDWAIKWALYESQVQAVGAEWLGLSRWGHVMAKLNDALQQNDEYQNKSITVEFALSTQSPIYADVQALTPYVQGNGLSWDRFGAFLNLRQRLFEIDTRFGQLGENGIFTSLDRAGVLEHHFSGVDNIEHAMDNPPGAGRAKVRGESIKRLSGGSELVVADWDVLWNTKTDDRLDLSDPHSSEEKWIAPQTSADQAPDATAQPISLLRRFLGTRRVAAGIDELRAAAHESERSIRDRSRRSEVEVAPQSDDIPF